MDINFNRIKLEQIYYKYKKLIYYAAYEILKDSHKSEEILQETMLKLIKYIDKLDLDNNKTTASYIYSVSRTIALEYARKEKHLSYDNIDILGNEYSDMDNYDFEDADNLESLINKLSPNYSEILILKYVHEMTNGEISELIGITEANVRKRIERAKIALRKLCEEEGFTI